jgi:hypothetical protein
MGGSQVRQTFFNLVQEEFVSVIYLDMPKLNEDPKYLEFFFFHLAPIKSIKPVEL